MKNTLGEIYSVLQFVDTFTRNFSLNMWWTLLAWESCRDGEEEF